MDRATSKLARGCLAMLLIIAGGIAAWAAIVYVTIWAYRAAVSNG